MSCITVSVIIPAYNAAGVITETLDSVLNQTFKDYEVIIVDDCSTDNTYDICQRYCLNLENFKVIRSEANFGCPGGPRNLGVKNAKGKYIAFLDADDLWHQNKLEYQINESIKLDCDFISTNLTRFDQPEKFSAAEPFLNYKIKTISYISQLFNYQTPTSSVLVKRNLMIANPFCERIELKAREDIDCWLRIHKQIGFSHKIKLPLTGYRVSAGQISGDKFKMIARTLYCYQNTSGISNKFLSILPIIATFTHFSRGFFNKIFNRGV